MFHGFIERLKIAAQSDAIVNPYHKNECPFVIACGSERGTTLVFAKALQDFLLGVGLKCYLVEMNQFENFKSMDHLIVLTSTYGVGGAPFNALQFNKKFKAASLKKKFKYTVVGFGSEKYPTFCQYAENVNFLLNAMDISEEWISLVKINDQSLEQFKSWFDVLYSKLEGQLTMAFKD
ncbi:MAG: flavodoxin family protein [Bacteroidota bacterium]